MSVGLADQSEGELDSFVPVQVRWAKRMFDIAGAIVGLLILLILGPFIALIIKLESRGPVLFRQLRVGIMKTDGAHLFEMLKFRSMVDGAEKETGPVLATAQEARITKFGHFLRKTRLDELPQFWNVLMGDMSLVGPRPERPELSINLDDAHPYFTERTYGLRPGITGRAQVEMTYDQCAADVASKIAYDFAYGLSLSNVRSFIREDVAVIFKTIWIVVRGRG